MKEVIIVGAGPAGLGVGVLLKRMNIPFIILERGEVGQSFLQWPEEMKFISPSFTGNFFQAPDLNAITPTSSPAYTLQTEHPTGKQYAQYLKAIADHYNLPVKTGIDVQSIEKKEDFFEIKTTKRKYGSSVVIWAAGEYQYPRNASFEGAEYCIHNSQISSWKSLKGKKFLIIGAYESGMDAAYQLVALGKKVKVLDAEDEISNRHSDSSYSLSPYTRDRYEEHQANIRIQKNSRVISVKKDKEQYIVTLDSGKNVRSKTKPILATGFVTSLSLIDSLFYRENGHVLLTENDESTKVNGLFLVGPQVQHNGAIFCFIYKYRQRFAVVAETIAKTLKRSTNVSEIVEEYKERNFYLRDLSCCGDECTC